MKFALNQYNDITIKKMHLTSQQRSHVATLSLAWNLGTPMWLLTADMSEGLGAAKHTSVFLSGLHNNMQSSDGD